MRFTEKAAIITGAGSGIGRATAQRLAEEGCKLGLVDLDAKGLEQTQSMLPTGSESLAFELDITNEPGVEKTVGAVLERWGRLDAMCNNAGIDGSMKTAPEQDLDEWQRILAVNLLGAVLFTKYASRAMQQVRKGAIVNTASVAGIRSGAGGNAYSASKAGIINFTQTAACDLGEWNVRVNAVCPGLVQTNLTKPLFDYARERNKEAKLGYRCELRRFARPEEIAAVIAFLASDDASYVTGQALPVDGGNTASLNMPGMKM